MVRINPLLLAVGATALFAVPSAPRAQVAVIDFTAIGQIIQEVQTTQQVLANARNQLQQAQQALQTMTGSRGMQSLLGNVLRNYLPADWAQLSGALQSPGTSYPALTAAVGSLMSANAVLSPSALSALSPGDQQRIAAARVLAAVSQALSRSALSNASSRFADIQSLIGTIGSAKDQKAILELQARIGAEQGMLQNEQTKLQSLYQTIQAEGAAFREQQQEQVIAGHGQFTSRFQPTP
jgi:type IV secretion system protein VirB5